MKNIFSRHVAVVLSLGTLGLLPASAQNQGRIEGWGEDHGGIITGAPLAHDIVQVSTGNYIATARRVDGSILLWNNGSPPLSSGPGFTDVAAGAGFVIALRASGSIATWGAQYITSGAPTGTGFQDVVAGSANGMALGSDGSIHAWGDDSYGQISQAPGGSGYTQIDIDVGHALALRADGSIAAWGQDQFGQVSGTPTGTGFTQIAAGNGQSLALRADGSIVSWGSDGQGLVSNAPTGTGFKQIAVGWTHAVAITREGELVTWGEEHYFGLLAQTPPGGGFSDVSVRGYVTFALRTKFPGQAYCFGDVADSPCPCGAYGYPGSGCAIPFGFGSATLMGYGEASLSSDSFGLHVNDLVHFAGGPSPEFPCFILSGSTALNGSLGISLGSGLLCVGGNTSRSQTKRTSTTGTATFADFNGGPFGLSSQGVGVPTHYQLWYRHYLNNCNGSNFNFSNALSVVWTP